MVQMWWSEYNLLKPILIFHVGIRDQTQDVRLGGKLIYTLSHPPCQPYGLDSLSLQGLGPAPTLSLCFRPSLDHSSAVALLTCLGPQERKNKCPVTRACHFPGSDPLKSSTSTVRSQKNKCQGLQTSCQPLDKRQLQVFFVKSLN